MNENDLPPLTRERAASLFTDESGAATAEYAITTMAAVTGEKHASDRDISATRRARKRSYISANR